jgi:hypothetical protein
MGILNLFRRTSKPATAARPRSFRPRIEALEDRLVPSANTFSSAGNIMQFRVVQNHLQESVRPSNTSDFGPWTIVPGCENWKAWDVKAVQEVKGNVDLFVNGTDGQLWEANLNARGAPLSWTNMKMSVFAFDATADPWIGVGVVAIQTSTNIMWQTSRDRNGVWSNYRAPGGYTFGFRDVAMAVNTKNELNVFGIGLNDHQVWWLNKPGSTWKSLGQYVDHVNAYVAAHGHTDTLIVNAWTGPSNDPSMGTKIIFNYQDSYGNWVGWANKDPYSSSLPTGYRLTDVWGNPSTY